jgi:hypothetical protein
MTEVTVGNRPDYRPAPDDRCAECGESLHHEWVSYRLDPASPRRVVRHFAGIIKAGPVEPQPLRPVRTNREFRYPDDVGAFFHSWCAPRTTLPEPVLSEIAELIARSIMDDYENTVARWAKLKVSNLQGSDPARCHAHASSIYRRRVFSMTRAEWEDFRARGGQLIELDVERIRKGDVAEAAAMISALAAECSVHTARIEVWRWRPEHHPAVNNIDRYLVLERLTRRLNVPMFAEQSNIEDSPKLRKHLREHVFIVKEQPDKGQWKPKARIRERLVFLNV